MNLVMTQEQTMIEMYSISCTEELSNRIEGSFGNWTEECVHFLLRPRASLKPNLKFMH